jgi:transposase
MHNKARTTPDSRADIIRLVLEEKQTLKAAAAAFSVCPKTIRKWVARYRAEGPAGLRDRCSRPHHSPKRIADRHCQKVWWWREQGLTCAEISLHTDLPEATLSRILHGHRPGPPPVVRYKREHSGELLHRITGNPRDHVRGAGWECVHICIDDHLRVSYAEVRPDEKSESAVAFLKATLAHCTALGGGESYSDPCRRDAVHWSARRLTAPWWNRPDR